MLYPLEFLYNSSWWKVVAFLFVVLIAKDILQKCYKYRSITSEISTIYGVPLMGAIWQLQPMNKFLYKLGACFSKSRTFLTWLGTQPIIVTIDPPIVKQILNSEEFLNKANILYQSIDNFLPNGLISSRFFKWKHNRKLMNPSFTPQILHRFIPTFLRSSEKIAQHFDSLSDENEHLILDFLQKSIMEVALETIVGLELKQDQTLSAEMVANLHKLMDKVCLYTALKPMNLGYLVRTQSYYKLSEYMPTFLKKCVAHRRSTADAEEGSEIFLARALKYQDKGLFDFKDTITETYTMITASYETTSTTLYSLIVMLAMHPDVQERLYEDVAKVIASHEDITYDHLEQLPYLNMVISETLRLVPAIPFIGREAVENCKLTDKVTLPRDFQVLISLFHLHRCESLWGPNAHKFNPDNFRPEEIEKRHPYAYVPYSKGVRNCIGWRYADISLKFFLLALIRKFKFSTSFPYEDLYFVQKISIQYLKEPKIKFTKRF